MKKFRIALTKMHEYVTKFADKHPKILRKNH
jgi:hypothetical protein